MDKKGLKRIEKDGEKRAVRGIERERMEMKKERRNGEKGILWQESSWAYVTRVPSGYHQLFSFTFILIFSFPVSSYSFPSFHNPILNISLLSFLNTLSYYRYDLT